jgi:hypothetical protein
MLEYRAVGVAGIWVYLAHTGVVAREVVVAVVRESTVGQMAEKWDTGTLVAADAEEQAPAPIVPETNPGASPTTALRSSRALETWGLPVADYLWGRATTVALTPVSLADARVATANTPNLPHDLGECCGDSQDVGRTDIRRPADDL